MYAGSCNPSRRAKRLRSGSASESAQLSPSKALPSLNTSPTSQLQTLTKGLQVRGTSDIEIGTDTNNNNMVVTAPPALQKRGRKPGLPRAAREAQRKLNHSIIEKARRTKINDALAALRAMVPVDYGSQTKEDGEYDDEDKMGDSEEAATVKDKGKPKEKGKREEKEKEFKLEILVRAVSFMQDLLAKVRDTEADENNVCPNCQGPSSLGTKRKRPSDFVSDEDGSGPSMQEDINMTVEARRVNIPDANKDDASPIKPSRPCRLPSISSWLPHPRLDPSDLLPSSSSRTDDTAYLPSPPPSTHSRPVSTTRLPPTLALDTSSAAPVQTVDVTPNLKFSSGSMPQLSPEDESAASLLLQISISSPSWSPSLSTVSTNAPLLDLAKLTPSQSLESVRHRQPSESLVRQAQTPSSLLGMTRSSVRTKV